MFDTSPVERVRIGIGQVTSTYRMFAACYDLVSCEITDCSNLSSADDMFKWCKLDSNSVANILSKIPTKTDNQIRNIYISADDEGLSKALEMIGVNETTTISPNNSDIIAEFQYKGWYVQLASCNYDNFIWTPNGDSGGGEGSGGDYPDDDGNVEAPAFSIVEGSDYIPDASGFNEVFADSGLIVTSIHNGYAWGTIN